MIVSLLDENSKPEAPKRKGWYVINNKGNIIEGPFSTRDSAQRWIDENEQTFIVSPDEVYSSDEKEEYKWCVINNCEKILAGPFDEIDLADEWIINSNDSEPESEPQLRSSQPGRDI